MKLELTSEQKQIEKTSKVSMVVAIYKSENFLDKLIESALNQTHRNLELILVDDGSPDNSGAICDKWAEKDDRIVVIHKENGGACDARNQGIKRATGDYLMITDGDDWLEPDYVEYLLSIAILTSSDMAMSDHIFTTRDREQVVDDHIEVWSPEEATINMIYPRIEIGPWNKIYKMELLYKIGLSFSVPWSGEGLYFITTFAQHANHIGVGHKKVYNYRLNNPQSGLTNYNVQMGLNAGWNIRNIRKNLVIHTKRLDNAVQWHIWKNYLWVITLIIVTNTKEKYSEEYSEAMYNVRKMLPYVIIHSEVSFVDKLKMIRHGLFPVSFAERSLKVQREALANDKMK